ncbi:S8 family peptidase [Laceyella putida]|uniref:S8 family peptidase n=1 Tax=Laceyella putida TaxID=110101 RepID=UPI0036D408EF
MKEQGTFEPAFLQQIKAPQAWQSFIWQSGRLRLPEIRVAVVDTGVDLSNPQLQPYLVPGANVRFPDEPPLDRMGHGTKVAGVIASVWGAFTRKVPIGQGKIMPIKVMEDGSDGHINATSAGMREAMKRKARIIVLAQGSWRQHQVLADVVAEAERRGVLVVAAVGNAKYDEQGRLLFDHPLYFPAAYPTVLAVGATTQRGQHEPSSNWGPGLDLVAPGEAIRLPFMNDLLMQNGTSFAAPQVAAVAALVWQLHPDYTPAELRQHLMQTTQSPSQKWRWDEQMGYGQLDAYQAVRSSLKPDPHEPNDSMAEASPITSDLEVAGEGKRGDPDVYEQKIDQQGWLELQVTVERSSPPLLMVVRDGQGRMFKQEWIRRKGKVNLPVGPGKVSIEMEGSDRRSTFYRLISHVRIGADAMEPNNEAIHSTPLKVKPGIKIIEGTMDHEKDQDWVELWIAEPGELNVKVQPMTPRFDPVLLHPLKGLVPISSDQGAEGESEEVHTKVGPGKYRMCIRDYDGNVADQPYQLVIQYAPGK